MRKVLLLFPLLCSVVLAARKRKTTPKTKKWRPPIKKSSKPIIQNKVTGQIRALIHKEFPKDSFAYKFAVQLGKIKDKDLPDDTLQEFKVFVEGSKNVDMSTQNDDRLVQGYSVPIPLQAIWGYGCWCHLGNDIMNGAGDPVNEMDQFCKDMQICLRCAVVDSENAGWEMCDPIHQNYNASISSNSENESILTDCTSANEGDKCAIHTCCCEMKLIQNILTMVYSNVMFDPQYQHSSGWNSSKHCIGPVPYPNPDHNDPEDKFCCGVYPNRFVYNKSTMECCQADEALFNPMFGECCPEDGVRELGNC